MYLMKFRKHKKEVIYLAGNMDNDVVQNIISVDII